MRKICTKFLLGLMALILFTFAVTPERSFASITYDQNATPDDLLGEETEFTEYESISNQDLLFMVLRENGERNVDDGIGYVSPVLVNPIFITPEEKIQEFPELLEPDLWFLLPPAAAIVTRIGVKYYVQQTLKNTARNIIIRNGSLANTNHPVTKVFFNKKGFPVFAKKAELTIPNELLKSSNAKQFSFCNKWLKDQINNNATVRARFNTTEINEIKNGQTPSGYVWHHHENTGVMQLVNKGVHEKTGHTGGRAIWGTT